VRTPPVVTTAVSGRPPAGTAVEWNSRRSGSNGHHSGTRLLSSSAHLIGVPGGKARISPLVLGHAFSTFNCAPRSPTTAQTGQVTLGHGIPVHLFV